MMLTRRSMTVGSAAVAASALVLGPEALAAPRRLRKKSAEGGQVVLDWERISFRTVYPVTPIPIGVPILGFVSLTMHRAAQRSAHLGASSESAAVAQAAHDVLAHYVPTATTLDGDLAGTLDAIGRGHAQVKGSRIGAAAARDFIASRTGDGWMNPEVHYTKTPGPGVWWPNAGQTDMLGAWLGDLRPLFVAPLPLSGQYPLSSSAWATDYEEVRLIGSTTSETSGDRTPNQTATAVFFNSNAPVNGITINGATMIGEALIRYLEAHPMGILPSAHLFAAMHSAITDSVICTWRAKRDVGFWRPSQAISGLYDDGNAATTPQPGWAPLAPNPNYSDYLSGHGSVTSPQVAVLRRVFGEGVQLELRAPSGSRTYPSLSALEADTFMARIWAGLHYRKAMSDTYEMGHAVATRVMGALGM